MTWREDRDALIAQTVAFVQSVTGKQVDFAQFALPPAPPAAGAVEPASSESVAATFVAPSQQPKAQAAAAASSTEPGKLGFSNVARSGTPSDPITVRPGAVLPDAVQTPLHTSGAFGTEPFTSIAGQIGLQRDMQTEIRTRVASFRAHQERFRRERQEYFSATLARLRASINETTPPDTK